MQGVERSAEPEFMVEMRAVHSQWEDLDAADRRRIRASLRSDFGDCCAYCQNWCVESNSAAGDNFGTVDHFQPRAKFASEWLVWLNLVYACRRCNDTKGNLWPEISDATNRRLSVIRRYHGVVAYVNPSLVPEQRPAGEFFQYRFESGQIDAAEGTSDNEWSMGIRTIADLDLNSDYERVGDRLPYLRRERLDFIIRRLGNPTDDLDRTLAIVREFTRPGQPFAAFILAYIKERLPLLYGSC